METSYTTWTDLTLAWWLSSEMIRTCACACATDASRSYYSRAASIQRNTVCITCWSWNQTYLDYIWCYHSCIWGKYWYGHKVWSLKLVKLRHDILIDQCDCHNHTLLLIKYSCTWCDILLFFNCCISAASAVDVRKTVLVPLAWTVAVATRYVWKRTLLAPHH